MKAVVFLCGFQCIMLKTRLLTTTCMQLFPMMHLVNLSIFVWQPGRAATAENQVSRFVFVVANTAMYITVLKKVINFLVAKSTS